MQIVSLSGLDLYIHCVLETKAPPHEQSLPTSGCTGVLHTWAWRGGQATLRLHCSQDSAPSAAVEIVQKFSLCEGNLTWGEIWLPGLLSVRRHPWAVANPRVWQRLQKVLVIQHASARFPISAPTVVTTVDRLKAVGNSLFRCWDFQETGMMVSSFRSNCDVSVTSDATISKRIKWS